MAVKLPAGNLYGRSLKTHQAEAFTLSERVYPPHFRTPKHSHERALFCFVLQGGYTETYGARVRTCEPATFLYHAPDERHAEHFHSAGGRSFIIEVEPGWLKRAREHSVVIDHTADFNRGILTVLSQRLYREFLAIGEASPLVMEGLMLEIMGETSRRTASLLTFKPPRWLDQAKQLLHDRFTESLTLTDIAQNVGVHPVHLAQVFHKHHHCTVGEYVRQLRIELACHELAVSDTPLCQIALAVGFADQSHFTRTFKRYIGVPPSQYRQLLARP